MKTSLGLILIIITVMIVGSITAQSMDYDLVWSNKTAGWARSVAISGDGNYVAAGSDDTFVHFFDKVGNRLWESRASTRTGSFINSVSVSTDGSYIAAGSDDSNVHFFDGNGTVLWSKDIGAKAVSLVSVAGDGSFVAASSENPDNKIYFINRKGTFLWSYTVGYNINGLSVSSDGSFIVTGTNGGKIFYFDRDGRVKWTHDIGSTGVSSVTVSSDGSFIISASRFNKIHLINDLGVLQWTSEIRGNVLHVSLVSNDTTIAVHSSDSSIYFFSIQGDLLKNIPIDNSIKAMSISSDETTLAAGYDYPDVNVYYYSQQKVDLSKNITEADKLDVAVLANSIDFGLAGKFFDLLKNNGLEAQYFTAADFSTFRDSQFIVILGGPDAPEGVGERTGEVLPDWEENQVRRLGAKKMYVYSDVWTANQTVIVLAGSNRNLTRDAQDEFGEQVIVELHD
jgi:WD40 repeat protein